ncbi:ligase-associated DNA damage response endonuclease PdeM [Prosthecobacter sp.]|uniref:ligase-associated DNA damage response endonuclease PdeM n=1 Tax=Prosthecobacter sp. TaxID=1965333 RepID=UPI003782F729
MRNDVTLEWGGTTLTLLPERAVWWAAESTLFIADPHFGKAAAFRFAGIPVPETSHEDDLERLTHILTHTSARRLVILGDFLHAKTGRNESMFAALRTWRESHAALEIVLVEGNHDRRSGTLPEDLRITCVKGPWPLGPFHCRHEPQEDAEAVVLAGHIHPSYGLSDRLGTSVRAPCFHFSARVVLLPAFGSFTGTHGIRPAATDRVFLVGTDAVIEVSGAVK